MLESAARPAIQTVETALREQHILELGYTSRDGRALRLQVEPLAIRINRAGHRVLWAFDRKAGHIEQLLLDGIESATDTGEPFTPREWKEEPGREPT